MASGLKEMIFNKMDKKIYGYYQYVFKPEKRNSWGGPFNNQKFRQKIFLDLIKNIKFDFLVETGTFRGNTTEYMYNESKIRIFSTEIHRTSFGFSRMRFIFNPMVKIFNEDSRIFLDILIRRFRAHSKAQVVFFYLDAHWGNDLPLIEEIEKIYTHFPKSVVMIDDFKVPEDEGYKFDDYGDGKVLSLDFMGRVFKKQGLLVFFPNCPSAEETGSKRGSVILVHDKEIASALEKIGSLKKYDI